MPSIFFTGSYNDERFALCKHNAGLAGKPASPHPAVGFCLYRLRLRAGLLAGRLRPCGGGPCAADGGTAANSFEPGERLWRCGKGQR